MAKELSPREIAIEYKTASSTLAGYEHHQDLDEEFQNLKSLEKQLFDDGLIFKEPSLLLNFNVTISEGDDNEKIADGTIMGIEIDQNGSLMAVVLKGHPKPILFNPLSTHIKPLKT